MRVTRLQIENFRSFAQTEPFDLGPINIFIGHNNAGKSSVLKALYALQESSQLAGDVRLGANASKINLDLTDIRDIAPWSALDLPNDAHATIEIRPAGGVEIRFHITTPEPREPRVDQLPRRQPNHFIVPYFSKRKTAGYGEDVREENAMAVGSDFTHLAAKLSRLGNPGFPGHKTYFDTCNEILGFTVTAVPSQNGQRPGVFLENGLTLPIDQMGDGVPNIVGLLADLALADGKLFLIEEPENDLHPAALKALLDLVVQSSSRNQLLVSTHSNIVVRHLGSVSESKVYYVDAQRGVMPPEATISLVEPTPEARLKALRDLGYAFSDFDLWDGWLILEEASAERIIRDYLVPWFAPKLTRIRTFAAGGNTKVEPAFEDFNRLISFTNLEEAYRNFAWVLIDGDSQGVDIIDRLRSRFAEWEPDRFECFSESQFESYYPAQFSSRVAEITRLGKADRRVAKKALLDEIVGWLDEDEDRGREALALSASPVINHLRRIEFQLMS